MFVESIFPLGIFKPFAFIINISLLFKPLSYLRSIAKDFTFTLDPSNRDNLYLSLISSRSKISLLVLRLYLNEGPPKTLIGPRILYPNIIGTWISEDLKLCFKTSSERFPESIAEPWFDFEKIKFNSGLI